MPRSLQSSRTRPTVIALVAAASVMLLSGCTGETPEPSATAAPPSAIETPSASAEPTEAAEPPVPFAIGCDELLTLEQVYEFNPNFGGSPDFEPSGEGVVAVVEQAGTACGWVNQTSGEIIEIGVATPPAAALDARKNDAAMGSSPVPTYGTPPEIEGYFSQTGGHGEAQVFSGPYWIVIDSPVLFEPGDAGQLVSAVLGNLPAA
ncbi:iron ABC transporter ATP-binding protein [Agromyces badenianii]|uniref:Iron ABC transporter ATP-binding protein n=1 Tax=Agromyces badenianii TaxID=2080742 RepID=A0A2S0WUM1_9MICO|nr:iron ABC transporter ATP-binding protein [Agromyces badenianii]AWB95046.1 iron ABC transporter ATP-binding protein [Agromyces badenianii]